jgi:hypothetical protein
MITIEPPHPGWGQIVGKTGIGLLTWVTVAFLVWIVISVLWTSFFQDGAGVFMAMIFMLVACIVTLIGTAVIAGMLNIAFGSDYYDFGKMFGFSILVNGLLMLLFAPVYFTFSTDLNTLLLILAFHIIFGFFISYSLIEFTTNPNYAWSSLIGTLIGFAITIAIYLLIYKSTINHNGASEDMGNIIYLLILLPFITAYTLIPLCHGIWSSIYYGIFGWWSNPFYIPSLTDINQVEEEDEVNVQL